MQSFFIHASYFFFIWLQPVLHDIMLLLLLFFLQESLKENSQSDVYSGRKLGQLKVLKHSHCISLKESMYFH